MKRYVLYVVILCLAIGLISLAAPKPVFVFPVNSGPAFDPGPGGPAGSSDKKYILRTFTWKNKKNETLKTDLKISKKALKQEINNFGIVKNMYHPQYLKKQGFKRLGEEYVVDYKEVYQRNLKNFKEITADLAASVNLKKDEDPLPDFLRFTQQLEYMIPPKVLKGRYIQEFYTPLQCLEKKTGDCDSKSVLLAEFLGTVEGSQEKFAVLILRGYGIFHAVLAIKRNPLPGTLKLYFHGKGYFMPLEASGPGWSPGFVGRNTFNCLKAGLFRFEALN